MNLKQAYDFSLAYLNAVSAEESEFKSLCTVCSLAGISNSQYALHTEDLIDSEKLKAMLNKLKAGEPLQYVLGKWDFYDREFFVGEGVLIPRPETEELVEIALKEALSYNKPVIYDLCAGSGCIGLCVAEHTDGTVYLIEKSPEAYEYLKLNAKGINNAVLINSDIFDDIDLPSADIIVSNPPYIKSGELETLQTEVKHEPVMALDGGADGLDFYRIINEKWSAVLKSGGVLLLEIGENQGDEVSDILTEFNDITVIKDIYGNNRIVKAYKR